MPFEPDPYRTLGLSRGATLEEVKRAYRRLAKANHPDAAGPAALSRFLAIQRAYEQLVGGSGAASTTKGRGPTIRRPSAADPDRTEATRRAYGGARPGPEATTGPGPTASRPGGAGFRAGERGRYTPGTARSSGRPGAAGPDKAAGPGAGTQKRVRGKATLGSTSYDGADAGPFEPDWGGASWYGTTSGTYWTINPKEYADPRKHGPEYQARARRAAEARDGRSDVADDQRRGQANTPTHTTGSWWDSTAGSNANEEPSGPEDTTTHESGGVGDDGHAELPGWRAGRAEEPPRTQRSRARARRSPRPAPTPGDQRATGHDPSLGTADAHWRRPSDHATAPLGGEQPAPDPIRAAVEFGRALTDPASGGVRGRIVRTILGWVPIALGIGWLVGELTGCGRFAATCDPSVAPLTAAGQAIVLVALVFLPELAAIAAGAALVLLMAAVAASLILSATGAAADEGSRRTALGALLLVAWFTGLAIALVRRLRSGPRTTRPVS